MVQLISHASKLLIQVLLTDSKISEKVLENSTDADKYKSCMIQDNGTIVLGKTSVHWWNQLLSCQDKIPFDSFALKVWSALVDMSSGLNNRAILDGLSIEVVKSSVREKKYDYVVKRLYDCWTHVAQNSAGYQSPVFPAGSRGTAQDQVIVTNKSNASRNIVIKVGGIEKTIPFVDSIGDPLRVGLDVGVIGIREL
jgi:hypothetical protein